jgi:hypothetical protein
MADVAAASSVNFIAPIDATRLEVVTMLSGALAGGDATLTVSKNGTNLSPTIVITSSGSALGDIVKGDRITVTTDGGGNSTVPITINATFTP